MKIALAQICSSSDHWGNLFQIQNFYEEARGHKCDLLAFPENVFFRGPHSLRDPEVLLRPDLSHSQFESALNEFFSKLEIPILFGSLLTMASDRLPTNRSWFVLPGGEKTHSYDKIHLFQFEAIEAAYNEALYVEAGKDPLVIEWHDWKFGLSICYDLRFPELYRHLTLKLGAEVLFVPSAFTEATGKVHWHTLLRARAIENQAYVLAPAQWGSHKDDQGILRKCFGHTIAYDPWGNCLGELKNEKDGLLVIDISKEKLQHYRGILPALKNAKL